MDKQGRVLVKGRFRVFYKKQTLVFVLKQAVKKGSECTNQTTDGFSNKPSISITRTGASTMTLVGVQRMCVSQHQPAICRKTHLHQHNSATFLGNMPISFLTENIDP